MTCGRNSTSAVSRSRISFRNLIETSMPDNTGMEQNVIIDYLVGCEHEVLVLDPPIRAVAFLRAGGYVEVGQFWAPGLRRLEVEAFVRLAMSDFIAERSFGWTDVVEFVPAPASSILARS